MNLHSILVLLKDIAFSDITDYLELFTFYSSSIKGYSYLILSHKYHKFTFYSSSIKGLMNVGISAVDAYLHSILVLLKDSSSFDFA